MEVRSEERFVDEDLSLEWPVRQSKSDDMEVYLQPDLDSELRKRNSLETSHEVRRA
jgi:hypothetical protein